MISNAQEYATFGWLIFPLHTPWRNACSCGRADCNSIGKHPRTQSGSKDGTTDPAQIKSWWTSWPEANIGILTGAASAIVVLDVDNKNGKDGCESFLSLASPFGGVPSTLTAITGTGKHYYFKHPGILIKNSVNLLAPGVDVRGDGGYVVAPPSLHANGTRYRWEDPRQPLADLPEWILAMIMPDRDETKMLASSNPLFEAPLIAEGSRNDTLHKLGSGLRGKQGMERTEIVSILLEYNLARCFPPLEEAEVIAIADSVCRYPPEVSTDKSLQRQEQNPLYWFPINTREWLSDMELMLMTDAQVGWVCQLMILAWANGGFLPADRDKLWRLAKAKSRAAFLKDCAPVLASYEEVIRDGVTMLKHTRLAAAYIKTLDLWMKRKQAGEVSQRKRRSSLLEPDLNHNPTSW